MSAQMSSRGTAVAFPFGFGQRNSEVTAGLVRVSRPRVGVVEIRSRGPRSMRELIAAMRPECSALTCRRTPLRPSALRVR